MLLTSRYGDFYRFLLPKDNYLELSFGEREYYLLNIFNIILKCYSTLRKEKYFFKLPYRYTKNIIYIYIISIP